MAASDAPTAAPAPHVPVLLEPILSACAPIRGVWLDGTFGAGGYNAVRGHGGINARVISPGQIKLGDRVFAQREDNEIDNKSG